MLKFLSRSLLLAALAQTSEAEPLGLGREALPEEIAAWDVNVMPDGTGLPEGSGDVWTGEEVFIEKCAACHGDFAEGLGNWPALAGGMNTLDRKDPVKTVGSYWPYLSTLWDYVHRSMPFGQAQTLTADETYAISAYILYSNSLVDDDFELSKDSFGEVKMTNADGFIVDDRPETEYPQFTAEPCMSDCKPSVEITMRASVLDVTPSEAEASESPQLAEPETEEPQVEAAGAQVAKTAQASEPANPVDPELIARGEKVYAKCKACHMLGENARNRVGPLLNGVIGRTAGAVPDFKYSPALAESGLVWDSETLSAFLTDPKSTVPGNKMPFAGLKKPADIEALLAYLAGYP